MKFSKTLHIISVVVGTIAAFTFLGAVLGGGDNIVFGITKIDALLCSGILVLFAIWTSLGAIHHMMLEKHGEIL